MPAHHRINLFFFLPAIMSALLIATVSVADAGDKAAPEYELSGADVIHALRKGGYIIYFRHAKSDHNQIDQHSSDLNDCKAQRNLSAEGRQQAKTIGSMFRSLTIKVDKVVSSPYCRARDTGELAFGKATIDPNLSYSIKASAEETERRAAALRRMLSTPPMVGANSVIVAHTSNLKEATGIWPAKEGVAIIFQPFGDNDYKPVATVGPDDWASILAAL